METEYCSYSVLPAKGKRAHSRKSCKKTSNKDENSELCEVLNNRCGLTENHFKRVSYRKNPKRVSKKKVKRAHTVSRNVAPKHVVAPRKVAAAPKPVVAAPKPVVAAPKPVVAQSKPVVAQSKPVVAAAPKPVVAASPKPVVAAAPKPVVAPYVFGGPRVLTNKIAIDELTKEEQQLLEKNGWTSDELARYQETASLPRYEKNEFLRETLLNKKALTSQEKQVLVKNGWDINKDPLLDSPNSVRQQFIVPNIKADEWFAERKRISEEQSRMARGPWGGY